MARRQGSVHRVPLTAREALLFEAGIKLGGIFHQYLGIPVTPRTAPALARTIEAAVALQPFVERVRVRVVPARGGPAGRGRFGYRYVTGEMIDARVTLSDGTTRVVARLSYRPDLRYPLMRVESASTPGGRKPRTRG
jgi:dihydroneopterin aldolase